MRITPRELTPRRRSTVAAVALLTTTLVLSACGYSDDSEESVTSSTSKTREFEADNGTIDIPTNPQRIVTIGSAGLFLDLGTEPVGMSPAADTGSDNGLQWLTVEAQQANESTTELGQGAAEFDYEAAASLKPDLIVVHIPSHAWEGGRLDEERLQSIAPTVYIEIKNTDWKTQTERLADAVGETETFAESKAEYEMLISEIADDYADLLGSTTFSFVNRWNEGFTEADGTFALEAPTGGYCTSYSTEAGLNIIPTDTTAPSEELSMERLSEATGDADAIIYPLGADGSVKREFAPIMDTNIWQSLPQTMNDRALGVQCNTINSFSQKVVSLESLQKALETLSEAE